jgi:hypothetical protein
LGADGRGFIAVGAVVGAFALAASVAKVLAIAVRAVSTTDRDGDAPGAEQVVVGADRSAPTR